LDSNEQTCEVVITAPEASWLAKFTRQLVESRLCAGSHIITEIRSIYRWRGHIEDRPEARVALHTRRSLVPEIVQLANEQHPYEVPCVVAWPITDGNPTYIEWIVAETREPLPLVANSEQS
jgi:periplasmic divalent cation tolerance protein